uniref:MFS transporter n=1 Tax=Rahnella sp. RFA10(1/100) TaxID=2511202 RepID=UPI00101F44AD
MQPAIFSLKILMLSSLIPDRHARQQAIGMFGGLVSVAAAAGPVLGGVRVGDFGWRSIFLINLPVGLYGICSGYRLLPAALPSRLRALDFTGQVLAMATLGCLSWVLIQLPEQEWGQSALPLMPLAFFLFVGNLSAGRLMRRWGIKKQMVTGLLAGSAGYAGMILLNGQITLLVFISMALLAGGVAFAVPPMTAVVLAGRTRDTAGTASAIHTTFRQTGSLVGIALAGLIFSCTQAPITVLMGLSALVHLLLALMNAVMHSDIP